MALEENNHGDLKGEIVWQAVQAPSDDTYYVNRLGLKGTEYIKGYWDKESSKIHFKAISKDDPHHVIGQDTYDLQLSQIKHLIYGLTWNHGDWKGRFVGVKEVVP